MKIVKSYKTIEESILFWEAMCRMYEEQIIELNKHLSGPRDICSVDYTKPRISGGHVKLSFSEVLDKKIIQEIEKIEKNLGSAERTVLKLKGEKNCILKKVYAVKGLKHKVQVLKYIDGLTIKEIAEKLNYSESHIKRISASLEGD